MDRCPWSLHDVNGLDSGHFFRRTRVDTDNFGVGIGATQHFAIKHAGTMNVVGIFGLPGNLGGSIQTCDALADQRAVFSIGP
jgi:hypothetical protein